MRMQSLVYDVLENRKKLTLASVVVQSGLAIAIILSTVLSIWETVPQIGAGTYDLFQSVQVLCGVLFLAEYVLRVWVIPIGSPNFSPVRARLKFIVRPMMIIDVTVVATSFLPFLFGFDVSSLRIFRLIRILGIIRFGRFSKSLNSIVGVIKTSTPELVVSLAFSFALLIVAATGIYHFEKDAQPQIFSSIPESIWWAVNALTGIWYGDVYPITMGGRTFAGFVSLLGVGTIALPAGIIASGIMESVSANKKSSKKVCPHCEESLEEKAA